MKIHTPVVDDKCWALERMREFSTELNYEGMNPAEVLGYLVRLCGAFEVVTAAAWLGKRYAHKPPMPLPMREENFEMVIDPWGDNDGKPLPAVSPDNLQRIGYECSDRGWHADAWGPVLHPECIGCEFYNINDECTSPIVASVKECPRGFKEISRR